MILPTASFRVHVDPTNPGQFFACCALLEFSGRLDPDAQGWFEDGDFCVSSSHNLSETLQEITHAELGQLDATDAHRLADPHRHALQPPARLVEIG